jgi:hypothetical protein
MVENTNPEDPNKPDAPTDSQVPEEVKSSSFEDVEEEEEEE